jgi:uncharacterized glyoxalase superfamily protein PhnB
MTNSNEQSPPITTERARISSIAPFFIVTDVPAAVDHYRERFGFDVAFSGAVRGDPLFAIMQRDGVSVYLKHVPDGIGPLPNPVRHAWARWDAFAYTATPDHLHEEFEARGAAIVEPLADTDEGLRGFAAQDLDGYVIFFGRPQS